MTFANDRVWPRQSAWMGDPETLRELTRLEQERLLLADEYGDERRADLEAEGIDDMWVGG